MRYKSPAVEATITTIVLVALAFVGMLVVGGLFWLIEHLPVWGGIGVGIALIIGLMWLGVYTTVKSDYRR